MQEITDHGIRKMRQSTGFGAKKNGLLNCRPNFQSNLTENVLIFTELLLLSVTVI